VIQQLDNRGTHVWLYPEPAIFKCMGTKCPVVDKFGLARCSSRVLGVGDPVDASPFWTGLDQPVGLSAARMHAGKVQLAVSKGVGNVEQL
jgi:hypothetical protein